MKTQQLGTSDIHTSSIVLGLMRISEMDDAAVVELAESALASGITMVDHADVYGGDHGCERRWAEAVPAELREKFVVQSKVGIVGENGPYFDFSREHILEGVDGSLAALQSEQLDVLLLHRPDALVEPDEVAAAFDELHAAGKVRHFGVSNQTPGQMELLKTAVQQPLVANQIQLSITHANAIAAGVAANMGALDQSIDRDNGIVDHARRTGVTLQAWSPFQKGFFDGVFLGDREAYAELNDVLDELAEAYGVTPTGIATAWITRHPADIQVVLGTTNPGRVAEAAAGADVRLTRPEWYRLFRAAGHTVP